MDGWMDDNPSVCVCLAHIPNTRCFTQSLKHIFSLGEHPVFLDPDDDFLKLN